MHVMKRPDAPTIAYDDLGGGDTALLLTPGWCVSRKVFTSLPELCARGHRVLAPDWRGHGESGTSTRDFGESELVQDILDLMRETGVQRVIPVARAHSGWVALELRRRLGPAVPRIVLLDWLVAEPPAAFIGALQSLQRKDEWEQARDDLFSMWARGLDYPELERFIRRDMGSYGFDMWSRAGREIERAYARFGSPLRALEALRPTLPVLHIFAQPDEAAFLSLQQAYRRDHPWFHVHKVAARSYFLTFEMPAGIAPLITEFAAL